MNVQDRIELLRALTEVEEWKSRAITAEKGQSLLKGRAKQLEAEVERAEAQAHEFESEAIHNGEIMQSLAAEVAALKARIAEMEATDQWHPVSEPPDKDGEYLIYRQPDLKYQPNARPDAAMMDVADYHAGRTNAKGELNEWSHNAIFMPITHWRPLPAPPQEAPAP